MRISDDTLYEVDYPYANGGVKHRNLETKKFSWSNYSGPGLCGRDKFGAGSALAVTVTEGEEDMVSAYEMLGSKYPVVSVQSSGSAGKDCAADKEFLDSFDKIYLCFDNDDQGRKAEATVSSMFPFNKIFIVRKTKYKDANEYQLNNAADEYRKLWYNAKRHDPENIVSSFADMREKFLSPKKTRIADFPFKGLNDATLGIRTGETYLFKALEGIGKTEVLGAIEYYVAKNGSFPFGIIHLEEDVLRSAFRLVGYEVAEPVHLEGYTNYTADELLEIYKKVVKEDNRINFYESGKNDNDVDSFLNAVRFMVASAGCRIVFFDHISRVASAFGLDTGQLDTFVTKLSKLTLELDFALIMISHVNADGDTRGSKNISKEAWTVISLYRDLQSPDKMERNTTYFMIEKNRQAAYTGPAGCVYFNPETFCLSDEPPAYMPPVGEE